MWILVVIALLGVMLFPHLGDWLGKKVWAEGRHGFVVTPKVVVRLMIIGALLTGIFYAFHNPGGPSFHIPPMR
jgi:hypothetical protein